MGLIVETNYGRLEGSAEGPLAVFRGIPFASAPSGRQRFAAPTPPSSWAGVRSAKAFGVAPWQSAREGFFLPGTGDDSLLLNVWTPGLDGQRPVIVWSPGGAFSTGSGAEPRYDGGGLAARGDVVVVTVNYRLGAMGFVYLDGLVGEEFPWSANAGLLDVVAALEWVKGNIAAFGGDPGNVTLAGQSAGAMAAVDLMAMPAAQGLFHRVIAQSGGGDDVASRTEAADITRLLLGELGLAEHQAEQLVDIPIDDLLAAQSRVGGMYMQRRFGLGLRPVIDGTVLPQHPRSAIAAGSAADVPLLIGSTLDEWRRMGDPASFDLDEEALRTQLDEALGGNSALVEHAYRALRPGASPTDLWFAIESDRCFRLPGIWVAEAQCRRRPEHTFMYLFTWPSAITQLRACHGIDVPFSLGSFDAPGMSELVGDSPDVARLAGAVQDAWSRFARSGDPNGGELEHWPAYEQERRSTMVFGADCEVVDRPYDGERAVWDALALRPFSPSSKDLHGVS